MSSISIKNEQGLALMGSLLLISMLAVMSTAFLLIMAADVRMAQSHLSSTQAYYMAESAAEIAALEISNDPSLALNAAETDTIIQGSIGEGEFYVFSHPLVPAVDNRRELRIQAISGKAWHDLYIDMFIPSQDPRTFYPVVSWNKLKLQAGTQVIGGAGVWSSALFADEDPFVDKAFLFDSPSSGNGLLYVSGSASWVTGVVAPELTGVLDLYTNFPALYKDSPPQTVDPYYPRLLDSENSPYPYYITGDDQEYYATVIPGPNVTGPLPSVDGTNPMSVYVWDYDVNGDFDGNFTINGTLVCPGTGRIKFQDGDVTISPLFTGTTPNEYYPAIIARGEVQIKGSGVRIINGLVYSQMKVFGDPDAATGQLLVSGAVIAREIDLKNQTVISYNDYLQTMPAAAFASNSYHTYPTLTIHRRRFIVTPP